MTKSRLNLGLSRLISCSDCCTSCSGPPVLLPSALRASLRGESRGRGDQEGRTYSQRTQLEAQRQNSPQHARLAHVVLDLRGRRRPDERQQHKWDEHGARLLRASRERSRHGGDSRLRARWPLCPQSSCARFMALEPRNEPLARRSQHGGQPARECRSAWDIGRIGWARSRKGQHAPHRAGRGEEAKGQGSSVPEGVRGVLVSSFVNSLFA